MQQALQAMFNIALLVNHIGVVGRSSPTVLFSKPIRAHELEWLALDSKRQDEVVFRPSLFMETMDAKFE